MCRIRPRVIREPLLPRVGGSRLGSKQLFFLLIIHQAFGRKVRFGRVHVSRKDIRSLPGGTSDSRKDQIVDVIACANPLFTQRPILQESLQEMHRETTTRDQPR